MTERPLTDNERRELPKVVQAVSSLPKLDQEIILANAELLARMKVKGIDLSPLYEDKTSDQPNA